MDTQTQMQPLPMRLWRRLITWLWPVPAPTPPILPVPVVEPWFPQGAREVEAEVRAAHQAEYAADPVAYDAETTALADSITADQPVPAEEPQAPTKRKYDSRYIKLRRDLAEQADDILSRFERLSTRGYIESHEESRLIEDLWGCDFMLWDPDMMERMEGGDKYSASIIEPEGLEDELADAVWPIDFAVAVRRENIVELVRVHTVTAPEVRGKVRQVCPKMLHVICGIFGDNDSWSTYDSYLGMVNKQWVLVDDMMRYQTAKTRYRRIMHSWASHSTSVALTARYEWHVAFGTIPNGPRILLPTNPMGCLKLFNNRDVAPGKVRRDRLKHWVEEHFRDEEEAGLTYVCAHLRGHTQFNWSGFGCELFVSAYDLEKNELFKKQAKEWRAQRKHNRVRVRIKKH